MWDGTSWSKGTPIASGSDAVIASNTAISSDSLQLGTILVDADFSFDVNEKSLWIAGDILNYGDWSNIGTVYLNGEATQSLKGKEWSMDGLLMVNSGTTLETNDSLRIKANSASDYGQVYSDGTVNGELEFEYYLDLTSGANNGRYFHLGRVLKSVQFADLSNGGILVTGGSDATKNTVWGWSPGTANWLSPSAGLMTWAAGYAVYAGNNQYGDFLLADGTNPGVISTRGTYNGAQSVGFNTSMNVQGQSTANFVSSDVDGWNFLCNPYSFNLDISDLLDTAGIANAVYYWRGTDYASYVGGAATNEASKIVAPGQGFWVQDILSAAGQSQIHSFNKTNASIFTSTSRYKTSGLDIARFSFTGYQGKKDEAVIGFNHQATTGFDASLDAWNMKQAGDPDFMDLSVFGMEDNFSIARFHPDTVDAIFLNVSIAAAHQESLSITADLSKLRSFNTLYLEDLKLNIIHDLVNDPNYVFIHDTTFSNKRFQLHFDQSSGLGQTMRESYSALYFFQKSEEVYLQWKNQITLSSEVTVFSAEGKQIESFTWNGQEPLEVLKNKPAGVYSAVIVGGDKEQALHSLKIVKSN